MKPVAEMTTHEVRVHAADVLADSAGLLLADASAEDEATLREALRLYRLAVDEDI